MSLRVFELAKELNIPTKELIKRINGLGIEIKGNFSALTDEQITEIKNDFLEPSVRVEETEVPIQAGVKKVKRRIISAKKAKEGKKIKDSLKTEEKTKPKTKKTAEEEVPEEADTKAEKPKRIVRKKAAEPKEKEEIKAKPEKAAKTEKEPAKETKEAPKKAEEKKKKADKSVEESKPVSKAEKKEKAEKEKQKTEDAAALEKKEEVKAYKREVEKEDVPPRKKQIISIKDKKAPKNRDIPPERDPHAKIEEVSKEPVKVTVRNKAEVPETAKVEEKTEGDKEEERPRIKTRRKDRKLEQTIEKDKPVDEFDKKQIKSLQKKDRVKLVKRNIKEELEDVSLGEEDFGNGFETAVAEQKLPKPSAKRRASKAAKRREKARRQAEAQKKQKHTFNPRQKELVVGEFISVGELASLIGIKVPEIIKTLMSLGVMATITQSIDGETAALVASEHGIELKVQFESIEAAIVQELDEEADLELRPPVVTIMGHVDHGKTSLLDKIRKTNVTEDESGGITQHIGAYHVKTKEGIVSFLDTPGHEAFTAMRARGADVTDIVILVVAADDGPRPQTIEAINHAKAADVAIVVAINKIDKPGANPEKTMQMLMEYELVAEEYGGDTPMIKVSAKTGEGIPKLLEMVHLQAEIMELKANPDRLAQGVVIESKVDKGRGNVATILIQNGTLRVGDNYVVGTEYGRVRAMWNDRGKKIDIAPPSMPVEIVGLNGVPKAGDPFNVGQDEKQVRQIAVLRTEKEKERKQAQQQKRTLENLFDTIDKEEVSILNLILKTDVNGSLEALADALERLGNEQVAINIIHGAVGAISSNDVLLATTSKAIIIGFKTRPDPTAKKIAAEENIDIRIYSVIYEAIEDVKHALEGMLKPIIREEIQGKAEVLEVFNIPKIGVVAGCKVVEGKFVRESPVRVIRDNVVIHDGKLSSLQRFKDTAKEVTEGFECGIGIDSYKDIKIGDELESYTRLETAAKL